MPKLSAVLILAIPLLVIQGCSDSVSQSRRSGYARVYHVANGCFAVGAVDPGQTLREEEHRSRHRGDLGQHR